MRWDFRKICRGKGSISTVHFLYYYVAFMLFSSRNQHHRDGVLLRGEKTQHNSLMTSGAALQGGCGGVEHPPHSSPTRQIVNLSRQNWIG